MESLGFILGGSWVVISGVISRVTIVITQIRGHITPLITTHEPPSSIKPGILTIARFIPAGAVLLSATKRLHECFRIAEF